MNAQRNNQSSGSRNSNGNNVDFAREIQKHIANQLCLARQENLHLNTDSYLSVIYENGIQGCLDKARMAIFHSEDGKAKYWIAYAWAWAKKAGKNITERVDALYPRENTVLAAIVAA